jgi:hypothetical protein
MASRNDPRQSRLNKHADIVQNLRLVANRAATYNFYAVGDFFFKP